MFSDVYAYFIFILLQVSFLDVDRSLILTDCSRASPTLQPLFPSAQIKAIDNGRPQKFSTARLHIEWIRRPPPSSLPLLFEEPVYNFTVTENDKVAEIVGVVSLQKYSNPLWLDITGKTPPAEGVC